ncbi:MAG: hypothetical protein IJA94_01840 [Bacilli bacterium]|nr:hypothetical protein [Bacilli bacterium]
MKKVIRKYFGVIAFYLVIVGGVMLVNYRFSKLNNPMPQEQLAIVSK